MPLSSPRCGGFFISRPASDSLRCGEELSSVSRFGSEESVADFICAVFSFGLAVWIFFRAADLERRKFFLAGVHESALIFAKSEACMFAFRRESRWKSGLCLIHFLQILA